MSSIYTGSDVDNDEVAEEVLEHHEHVYLEDAGTPRDLDLRGKRGFLEIPARNWGIIFLAVLRRPACLP